MMPRLSGFEVCKKLRADPKTRELLILMVTALNEPSDFERGVQVGTDDFLTKPVNKVELLCRIRSLLRVRHLKSQLDRTLAYLAEVEKSAMRLPPGLRTREIEGGAPDGLDPIASPARGVPLPFVPNIRPPESRPKDRSPMASLPRVIIKPRRARPFFARHPWVFVTSIDRVEGDPSRATRSSSSATKGSSSPEGSSTTGAPSGSASIAGKTRRSMRPSSARASWPTPSRCGPTSWASPGRSRPPGGLQRVRRALRPDRRPLRPLARRAVHQPGPVREA